MIRDRAAALVRAVAGSLDDPFLVAELGREDIGRLADEAASLALTGGRRVVRLREATDAATEQVAAILKGPAPALVVLEAPGLPTRSRLRSLVEAAPDGAAIACYPEEGRALADTIRAVLTEAGVGYRRRCAGLGVGPVGGGPGVDQAGGGEACPVCRARRAGGSGRRDGVRRRSRRPVAGRCAVRRDRGRRGDAPTGRWSWRWPREPRRLACCGRG